MKTTTWMALALVLAGCTGLQAPKVADTHLYTLDAQIPFSLTPSSQTFSSQTFSSKTPAGVPPVKSKLVLAVSMPSARPGFDTPQMAYQQHPLELDYFATHRWADTPAHMLRPLLTQSLEPVFQSVVNTPGIIPADIRLDTEIIRLRQDFTTKPSRSELVLRAQLTDLKDKRVIAVKLFSASVAAGSEDAYGGVVAANLALQEVLEQLTKFCINPSADK